MQAFAGGRRGYVVWESRRPSGTCELKYRVWKRNLDGAGLAMISGEARRAGYAHLGPRISPDGRFVVFAGRTWSSDGPDLGVDTLYGGTYVAGPFDAWVVEVDPATLEAREPRELVALRGLVGTAGQDRFFAWKDGRTILVYIPAQKGMFEVDVITGEIGAKVAGRIEGAYATGARARWLFSAMPGHVELVALREGELGPVPGERRALPGCQAVLSDGEVLAWMRTSCRIGLLDLRGKPGPAGLGEGRTIDARRAVRDAHEPYHYCYFPAVSGGRSILAFGASRFPPSITGRGGPLWSRHCQKSADYEIFLLALDPDGLEPVGAPVRYSFNDHRSYPSLMVAGVSEGDLRRGHVLDRCPDAWVEAGASGDGESGGAGVRPEASAVDAARGLESVNPPAALARYDELARRGGRLGRAATERAQALRSSAAFRRELAAWEILERMWPPGTPHAVVRAGYMELRATYGDTRAMLEARALVQRLGVPVPEETAASRRIVAVIDAVAIRVSVPKTREDIHPYTQALLTAEFQVRGIVRGALPDRTCIVVLRSMDDGVGLPAASLKPGDQCRLRLALWDEQRHLHSLQIADDILELDATYYFAR